MGGFNGIMGEDWMPPSPSPSPTPPSFFSPILGYDTGSPKDDDVDVDVDVDVDDNDNNNNTSGGGGGGGFTFPGPDKQFRPENGEASSRSDLVQRMAARAGYNAPRLNTDLVRPCPNYLTIPPGLSPTSLLDSPVFLSNSLVQPSPTTGKFPFAPNANMTTFSDLSTSSFAFKPVPESAPTPVKVVNPPLMSWQSFPSIESGNRFPPQSIEADKVHSRNGNSDLSAEVNKLIRPFGANVEKQHHDEDADQIMSNVNSGPSEDGYNWRKYGQKQVKGSEYPRSYYKCTHPNCPVKKKVERSHEGHITEIIYKGAHNHPKPPPGRRSSSGVEGTNEVTSSTMDRHGPSGSQFESSDAVDGSLTFSNEEEEDDDDGATHGSFSLGYDGEGDESESKRRKVEAYAADVSGGSRGTREPRVVVQTTSEVDILDDGYRWRKYGQKVVKGNPNPRSYYKCTSTGCTVRKHVERASHDLKSVITTYEGKHNHDVPPARNNNNHHHQSQIQNRIESRHDAYGYGYGYGGTAAGMEGKMPTNTIQYMAMLPKGEPHHQYMNMAMLPKGEPPPSLYHHQIINNTFLPHI